MLKHHGLDRELDGGDDYFHAWLETLEVLLAEQGEATPDDVKALSEAWEEAYLTTPSWQARAFAAGLERGAAPPPVPGDSPDVFWAR